MSTSTLDLPTNLTISSVEALHEKLEPLLLEGNDIAVDGASVERADTAGLQLLLVFKNALAKRRLSFTWVNPSAALTDAARQIGLENLLAFNTAPLEQS